MKKGVTLIGLIFFGTGALLATGVAVEGLMARAACETGCGAIDAGLRQSGLAALILTSMAVLAFRQVRGRPA